MASATCGGVDEHLERLEKTKQFLPRYHGMKILEAMTAMVIPNDVTRYAYRQGLFVIAKSGDDMVILNDLKSQPKNL